MIKLEKRFYIGAGAIWYYVHNAERGYYKIESMNPGWAIWYGDDLSDAHNWELGEFKTLREVKLAIQAHIKRIKWILNYTS